MRLVYQDSLPFEIKTPKKSLEILLSNEIADNFNYYYTQIVNFKSNNTFNKDTVVEELSVAYKPIALKIEDEIRQSGNMKARHTQYEMEFILACSYKLIEKFDFKQADLAKVFGLKPNEFGKLGVYPIRSYKAYNKLQSGYLSMLPSEFGRPKAVDIADYLNKHIQAPYCCSSTILVTNELDVIANVATTDAKDFLLTRPSNTQSATFSQDTNYSFARLAFALGNHLKDGEKKYPAGKLRQKILDIIDMKDSSAISGGIRALLASEESLSNYVKQNETVFNKNRDDYRFHLETIRRAKCYLETDSIPDGVEFNDEHFGAYNTPDYREAKKKAEKDVKNGVPHFESSEEVIRYHLEQSSKKVIELEDKLMEDFSGITYLKDHKEEYYLYLKSLEGYAREITVLGTGDFNAELRASAFYYLVEVLKDCNVNEETVGLVREHVNSPAFFKYLDAIDKDSSGIQIACISDSSELIDKLIKLEDKKGHLNILSGKGIDFTFLYIDLDAYNLTQYELDTIMSKYRVIVALKGVNSFAGVEILNKKLSLYSNIKEKVDGEF